MKDFAELVGKIVIVIALVAFVAFLGAYPTKWLVNYLFSPVFLTYVFGTAKLGFWQALSLNAITGLLFKTSQPSSK